VISAVACRYGAPSHSYTWAAADLVARRGGENERRSLRLDSTRVGASTSSSLGRGESAQCVGGDVAEIYDARKEPLGMANGAQFDDSSWQRPVILGMLQYCRGKISTARISRPA